MKRLSLLLPLALLTSCLTHAQKIQCDFTKGIVQYCSLGPIGTAKDTLFASDGNGGYETFSGVPGSGTVTSFAAPSGSWPTWLVPTVTNSTSTPSLAIAASVIPVASGGTGTATPSLVAGTNITVSGTWPNQTVNSTASGSGTVTHTIGALTSGQLLVGNGAADLKTGDLSGDVSTSGAAVTTLATVNSNVGTFGDATHVGAFTVNAKGLVTAASSVAITGGGSFTVGGNGTLDFTGGVLDTINGVVPRLTNSENILGLWNANIGLDYTEQASGTTPAAGSLHIYANTDHTLHQITSGGVDTVLGGGGGSVTQLVDSGALPTVKSVATTSAVNWLTVKGSATTGNVTLSADGSDSDVGINIPYKGAAGFSIGKINLATSNAIQVIDHFAAAFAGMYIDIDDPLSVRIGGGAGGTVLKVDPATSTTTMTKAQVAVVAVAGLATCNSGAEGTFSAVNDAAATPVYNAIVAGGGSVHIPVYCNGTNWVNH